MALFFDRVAFFTATTGTGTVNVGAAITDAFLTPAEAGVENNDSPIPYLILDGADFEIGVGTYSTGSPPTFARDTVTVSKIGGTVGTSKINLSGEAQVRFAHGAEELDAFLTYDDVGTSAGTVAAGDDSRITGAIQTGSHAATSVIGRSANSSGDAADIAASTNDRILARVSNALSWVQLTIGMIPDSLITFAKLASGAVASFGEFNTATASKLLSTASVWASPVALSDAATISIDLNNGYDFTVTLGGNRTLGAPSNVRHGKKGIIWVSASGATRTLTLNGAWVLEDDAEEGPYEVTTSERLGICYACDNTTARVTGILRYS